MAIAEIRGHGAPDFLPHIGRLLSEADIKNTPDAYSDLITILDLTWSLVQLDRQAKKERIPAILFKNLNASIKNTQRLLRRLEKFQLPSIDTDKWPVLNGRAIKPGKMLDVVPAGATWVIYSRRQMLDRLLREISRYNPKRLRGHQPEPEKSLIVGYAGYFFRLYSPMKPTSYVNGPFSKFCRAFYEVVTGEKNSRLEKLIRNEAKTPALETQTS
jgi:hypothetical protein